jgi:hypothetical protein
MTQTSERRRFTRVTVDVAVRIHTPEAPMVEGRVTDLSLGGVRVATDTIPADGVRCAVELDIPGDGSAKTLAISGAVVRGWDGGAAVEFRDADPGAWEQILNVLANNEFDRARLRREAERAGR